MIAYPGSALHVATLAGHKEIVRLIVSKGCKTPRDMDEDSLLEIQSDAANLGDLDIWRELLSYGVPPDEALQCAARAGDRETFEALLGSDANVDPSGKSGDHQRALESAARGGHTAIVRDLLSRGVEPNMDSPYRNILAEASRAGNVEIIEMLIAAGADFNPTKNRPLTAAIQHGHENVIRVLIKHGTDVNAENYEALFAATSAGRLDIFKVLLELDAELPLNHPKSTRLIGSAVYGGSARLIQFLFEQGVNPKKDVAEEDEDSDVHQNADPILNAIKFRHPDIVLALLDGGMNVNRIVKSATPLSQAIYYEDDLLAANLLDRGADVNLQKSRKCTAPLLCAINRGMISIVKLLLERQANPNQHGTINRNQPEFPLLLTAEKGYMNMDRLLIEHGASINEQDDKGFSALHGAAGHGQDSFVKMLVEEYEADPTVCLVNGSMPIHTAAARGNPESIEIFLKAGLEPNVTNNDGRTPLHWAAKRCQWDNVKLLLDKGARTDLRADGKLALTPLDLAHIGRTAACKRRSTNFEPFPQHRGWSKEDLDELFTRIRGSTK